MIVYYSDTMRTLIQPSALFFLLIANPFCSVATSPIQEPASTLQSRAETGDVVAELELAKAYSRGDGMGQNHAQAVRWFREAAEHGNAEAQDNLGVMYVAGEGVERDKAEGLKWYQKAARQGYAEAWFHLGTVYYNGDAVEISDSMAYAWFALAKQSGNQKAAEALTRLETELRPAQQAQGLGEIGKLFDDGVYLPKNPVEAARWWLEAAEKGNLDAKLVIASKYLTGEGIAQDFGQARSWCNQALKEDKSDRTYEPRAAYCLGVIEDRGLGVEKNSKAAREWYERAASNGHGQAAKRLAQMYTNGEGGKTERVRAALILVGLIRHNDPQAETSFAELRKKMDQKEWDALKKELQARHVNIYNIPGLASANP